MEGWLDRLGWDQILTAERILQVSRALLVLVVGAIVARLVSRGVTGTLGSRMTPQQTMLLRRSLYYGLLLLVLATSMHQVGFQLSVLLGAAGVLTVALGFASQTSASNLISGLFLVVERPFEVGDVIRVDGTTGEVLSVDLLSVKLRTFDNLFVRIPNETIIKTQVTTLTAFPIRRADIKLGVAYKEDLVRVRELLQGVADRNPLSLDEPEPLFIFERYGESALEFQFSVWAARENFLELRTSIQLEIKEALDEAGIEIPFPHRTLYTGAQTTPLPVRVVQDPVSPANPDA